MNPYNHLYQPEPEEEEEEEEEEFELDGDELDDVAGGGRGAPTAPTFGGQRACGC